jgi:hypothetical protein
MSALYHIPDCLFRRFGQAEHWRNPGGEPLTGPEVCRAFRDGFTIAVRGITARSAPVLELCAGVGRVLGLFAGANIYLTPPGKYYNPPFSAGRLSLLVENSSVGFRLDSGKAVRVPSFPPVRLK